MGTGTWFALKRGWHQREANKGENNKKTQARPTKARRASGPHGSGLDCDAGRGRPVNRRSDGRDARRGSRRGWTVAAEFIDPGVSGTTMDRPGLQAMLAAAEQRSFDILMVHELSRLSRSVFDTFDIFEQLGRYQIGFVSLKEPQFDLTTPTRAGSR